MSQRPTIQKPTPLTAPQNASADPVMGGVNIPKFSAEMSAEISPEAAPLWNFVQNHASQIAAAVVSLVVIILAIAGWQWYVEKQLAEAKGQLGRIISIQDPARRVTTLEQFLGDVPSELKVSATLELAVAAAESQDWAKAASAYAKVAEMEKDTALAFAARMNHAQLLLRSGDYAGARAELSALIAKAPAEAVAVMHQMAGEAAALAGDKTAAVTSYEAALAALPPTDSETSAYFRARIAQLKK